MSDIKSAAKAKHFIKIKNTGRMGTGEG